MNAEEHQALLEKVNRARTKSGLPPVVEQRTFHIEPCEDPTAQIVSALNQVKAEIGEPQIVYIPTEDELNERRVDTYEDLIPETENPDFLLEPEGDKFDQIDTQFLDVLNICQEWNMQLKEKQKTLADWHKKLREEQEKLRHLKENPEVPEVLYSIPPRGTNKTLNMSKCLGSIDQSAYQKCFRYFGAIENELRRIHAANPSQQIKLLISAALYQSTFTTNTMSECQHQINLFLKTCDEIQTKTGDVDLRKAIDNFKHRVFS